MRAKPSAGPTHAGRGHGLDQGVNLDNLFAKMDKEKKKEWSSQPTYKASGKEAGALLLSPETTISGGRETAVVQATQQDHKEG